MFMFDWLFGSKKSKEANTSIPVADGIESALPCPCCGSKRLTTHYVYQKEYYHGEHGHVCEYVSVVCTKCGAESAERSLSGDWIDNWNSQIKYLNEPISTEYPQSFYDQDNKKHTVACLYNNNNIFNKTKDTSIARMREEHDRLLMMVNPGLYTEVLNGRKSFSRVVIAEWYGGPVPTTISRWDLGTIKEFMATNQDRILVVQPLSEETWED